MATSTESGNSSARPMIGVTPLFAVVGVTDLAVQQVRAAAAAAASRRQQFRSDIEARLAGVEKRVNAIDPKLLRTQAEAVYEELASRGRTLVDRVYTQADTQALRTQAGYTLSRGKAAVTVARRAADDTASAIRGTLSTGRAETAEPAGQPAASAGTLNQDAIDRAVAVGDGGDKAVTRPRTAAKKPTTTVRKNAAATKVAAKGAGTSARKTAGTGTRAAKSAAKKVGD
ncbi:hypothetical protein KIH74_01890 [Kineosporia sp. J2-2]|uniref:Heparin binding hemagglutinin HbhA n=1 Tax=Kineosporia corallincola TaxID=2835133 RepID=A0ABS5T9D8_9ACTN|nr:hypothetical protein [Kineosporia corallincola]MBT0767657.1 hypothetical protein [Kineosporia corallincola]